MKKDDTFPFEEENPEEGAVSENREDGAGSENAKEADAPEDAAGPDASEDTGDPDVPEEEKDESASENAEDPGAPSDADGQIAPEDSDEAEAAEDESAASVDEEAKAPEDPKARAKRKKKILIITGIIIAAIVVIYIAVSLFYRDKFLMHTYINGIECSGMTSEEALLVLEAQADSYVLTISERGDVEETIPGEDISYSIEFGTAVDELLAQQNPFAWPAYLSSDTELAADCEAQYDEEELLAAVNALECADEENMTVSEEPKLSEYDPENGYTLVDEVYGTTLDVEYLYEITAAAITAFESTLDLEEAGCYTDPVYTTESEEAIAMLETANTYAGTTVNYTFDSTNETVDYSLIGEWLIIGEDLSVTLDTDAAAEYISELADKYDTYGKSKTLATSYGTTVTVPGGNYGWKMDQSTTLTDLISYIESGTDYSGDVTYSQTAESHGTNDYGSTYVEINLTAQYLYFYKNGSLVISTDIVTGNVSAGNDTDTGAYRITYKQTNRTLRGDGYASFVNYWMPFNGGQGLHDATWRSNFGGTIYKTNGSHGCVNLPYSAAKTIYNNISTGDAVLIYTLAGTERKSTAEKEADEVEEAIDAIGTVTLESESAITNARTLYDALSSSAKKYVDNLDTLEAAEEAYAALVAAQESSTDDSAQ